MTRDSVTGVDRRAPYRRDEWGQDAPVQGTTRAPGIETVWPAPRSDFRRLLDRLPAAAYTCDAEGHITYFNRHARELWGREPRLNDPADRFCGSWRLRSPDGAPIRHDESWMARALKDRAQYDGREIVIECPDGARRDALAHAAPIYDDSGRLVGAVNVLWDVTEYKRADAAVREADRRKDDFLATLAHELRNPLAPLRTAAAVIRMSSGDPATVAEYCLLMERQLQQLGRVVDDLIDLSDLTHYRLQLDRRRIDLTALARTIVEQNRLLVERADLELSVTLPEQRIVVDADPLRLGQVLTNLLSNAVKYTPRGGRIELSVVRAASGARVSVRDNGLGIPPDKLEMIFEMSGQLDRSLETGYKGLGVGLTLARALIDMHGGTIEARSDGIGKGSEFSVWLPIAVRTEAFSPTVAPYEVARGMHDPGGCRVLLVDDNRDVVRSMTRFVRQLGHDIRVAFDGQEAVEIAGEFMPDVVLLDIGLPKLNGYDVARELRAKPWGDKMIIVAVTGWGRETDRRQSREAGFDTHMTKPVDPAALEAFLNSCSTRLGN
jgi:signal transduction histidine kinase